MEWGDLFDSLALQFASQTELDWLISLTAIVYVVLAARENAWCWVWGTVSCSLWAYADFFRYNLWVDGLLQLFYAGMGIWGLYHWRTGGGEKAQRPIITKPMSFHVRLWLLGGLLTVALGLIFDAYTPTSLPYPDSFITAFSMLATYLTVKKVLENWLYWIILDAMAVFLFLARDAVLVACVMIIYTVVSVFGFYHWKKQKELQV